MCLESLHFALFSWRKSGNILPYFCDKNPAALLLVCVIAHKTLSSPSFCHENTEIGMPHFHGKNPVKFCVWCAMAHRQGFMPMYTMCANMLILWQARASQSIEHIDTCHIHKETVVTWWHGARWSHRGDYAHNMTWICTCNKCLKRILMPQGQEHSWLKRVAHIATKVHHTKSTITHTYACIYIYIYIHMHHAQYYHTE